MANFEIFTSSFLGVAYGRNVMAEGSGTVELTDEEVRQLVELIRKNEGDSDVDELKLKKSLPNVFRKLDKAYSKVAYKAVESHWTWSGYKNHGIETDVVDMDELMEYCEENCGFEFEYDEDDYLDDGGELDDDRLDEDKWDAFCIWVDDYLQTLSDEDAVAFMSAHLGQGVELEKDDYPYEVEIPEAIVKMAEG